MPAGIGRVAVPRIFLSPIPGFCPALKVTDLDTPVACPDDNGLSPGATYSKAENLIQS
jgi:hypothetical protein